MVDLGMYVFKYLNTGKITPEESFNNAYAEEEYESEYVHTSNNQLHVIFDAKYENADLHKIMENKFQHLTMTQCNELLKLLQKLEELFNGTLGTRKNRFSRIWVKRGHKDNMLATITSTRCA